MKYILCLLPLLYNTVAAQQKESTVFISCYVNPELYLQATVIAQASDKAGNISCTGKYIKINNKSSNTFYYKNNNKWLALKPQTQAIVLGASDANTAGSPSRLKLSVKYKPDVSASVTSKISAISEMNKKTDQLKARELESKKVQKQASTETKASETAQKQPSPPAKAAASSTASGKAAPTKAPETALAPEKPARPAPAKTRAATTKAKAKSVAKAKPKSQPKQSNSPSITPARRSVRDERLASRNAIGLRIDFGKGATGLGPNFKHRFNRNLSLDAAIVFFEGDVIGLGAQLEQSFPLKGSPGLDWYIGIGPQLLSGNETTAITLVPVTGLDYNMPRSPVNISFDWRPNFYISPDSQVQAGRFGLSVRIAF